MSGEVIDFPSRQTRRHYERFDAKFQKHVKERGRASAMNAFQLGPRHKYANPWTPKGDDMRRCVDVIRYPDGRTSWYHQTKGYRGNKKRHMAAMCVPQPQGMLLAA